MGRDEGGHDQNGTRLQHERGEAREEEARRAEKGIRKSHTSMHQYARLEQHEPRQARVPTHPSRICTRVLCRWRGGEASPHRKQKGNKKESDKNPEIKQCKQLRPVQAERENGTHAHTQRHTPLKIELFHAHKNLVCTYAAKRRRVVRGRRARRDGQREEAPQTARGSSDEPKMSTSKARNRGT